MPKVPGAGRKSTSTKAEIQRRVAIVTELVIRGYTPNRIWELLEQNEKARGTNNPKNPYRADLDWGVKKRVVDDYYRKATIVIGSLQRTTIEQELSLAKARYEDLIRRAIAAKNLHAEARALRDKVDLLQLQRYVQVGEGVPNAEETTEDVAQVRLPDGSTIEF